MEMKINRFDELTVREVYEILRCRSEVFVVGQECVYQDIDELDFRSTHLYFEDNGKIAAYLRIIDPGVKFPSTALGRVLTMPTYRGHGLARKMMTEAIRICKTMSDTIEIEAQAYLVKFYESLGFVQTSEIFMYENRPHVSMILK